MRGILLAAGMGSRLYPLTRHIPKCMLPVNGRPLLEYWIRSLRAAGVGPLLINLHYLAEMVQDWLQPYVETGYVQAVYETELLGTAGTLLENLKFFDGQPLMLIHADNLCLADLKGFIRSHLSRPAGADMTMMTFYTQTPESCGIVELDEYGMVQAFHEKVKRPPGNLANAAVYILQPQVAEFLRQFEQPCIDFSTEVLPKFLGRIFTWHNGAYHRDIGTLKDYLTAQTEYPGVAEVPARQDLWQSLCQRDHMAISRNMIDDLAAALNVKVMTYNSSGQGVEDELSAEPVIFNMKSSKDVEAVRQVSGALQSVLFFPQAEPGFSSKQIFDRHGLQSLAVCTCR